MSKELFFEFRAEEIAYMYDENFSKKQAIQTGIALANKVLDDGLIDPFKVFSNVCRLKEVITAADKEFRDKLSLTEIQSANGVQFSPKAGSQSLIYEDDAIYRDLARHLKAREVLLKEAFHSKTDVPDLNGEVVPKVKSKFSKSSITINF